MREDTAPAGFVLEDKDLKKIVSAALTGCLLFTLASCTKTESTEPLMSHPEAYTEATVPHDTEAVNVNENENEKQKGGPDYWILVNKTNKLPDNWEDSLETVTVTNSVGDDVEVEVKTYNAYLLLKEDLEKNDGIYLELDSGRRSVAAQQEIMDRFTEEYGADYAAKTVAVPGYSEHHTGLAIDLYFRLKGDDGSFRDVYYNEDLVQYPEIWEKIHSKLADYGFILRYLEGREHITGYGYEPWHIRYIDDVDTAKEIMAKDITFEEFCFGGEKFPQVTIDLGESSLYTAEDLTAAVVQVKCQFAFLAGGDLREIRYAGDGAVNDETLAWLNSLAGGAGYKEAVKFVIDFYTLNYGDETGNSDEHHTDYPFWLARNENGGWDVVTYGEG